MPMHSDRSWVVTDTESADELVNELKRATWTPCTGFRLRPLLFLNDATAPGRAEEYAIIIEDENRQVESITVSWMDPDEIRECIQECYAYVHNKNDRPINSPVDLDTQTKDEHGYCQWCR